MLSELIVPFFARKLADIAVVAVTIGVGAAAQAGPPGDSNLRGSQPHQALPPSVQRDVAQAPTVGPQSAKSPPKAHSEHPPQAVSTVELKEGESPKIEMDTPIYDFGRIKAGGDISHDFWFTNSGTGPLEITMVKPSCGCTTSGPYDRIVQPGQSGKIPIKVSMGASVGPITKTISVFTNAKGPGSMVTLQIKGVLWQAIEANPNMATFGNISSSQVGDATMVRKLTIVNNLPVPATLSSVISTNPSFKAEVAVLEAGKKFELTVKLDKPSASGVQAGSITMNTGLKEKPSLQIPVNAYILADVDVVPNKIVLPKDRTAALQRDFYVRNNSKKPIKVSDVRTSDPHLKVTMTETQPGMAFNLKLDVPMDYKVPVSGDTITLNTDNPAYPIISVPVTEVPFPASSFQTAQRMATPPPVAGAVGQPAVGTVPPGARTPSQSQSPKPMQPAK